MRSQGVRGELGVAEQEHWGQVVVGRGWEWPVQGDWDEKLEEWRLRLARSFSRGGT